MFGVAYFFCLMLCFWWKMVSFAEKFEPYQPTSGLYWGRTKESSICFEGEGFYHIWTKKGWYVWMIFFFLKFWLLSCVWMLLFNVKQKMLWPIKHVFYGLIWRSLFRTMLHYFIKLVRSLGYTCKTCRFLS